MTQNDPTNQVLSHVKAWVTQWQWHITCAMPWQRQSPAARWRNLGLKPGQSMCNLWWTKWPWNGLFSEYFGFPLSLSIHHSTHLFISYWHYIILAKKSTAKKKKNTLITCTPHLVNISVHNTVEEHATYLTQQFASIVLHLLLNGPATFQCPLSTFQLILVLDGLQLNFP